jgi:diaminopimelate epimerase
MHLQLTKHHGLGNDFLVVLGEVQLDGEHARRLCDRRRGVGADGLIVGGPPTTAGSDLTMVLYNADGGRAEMSGNGIRCLAQAVARRRGLDRVDLVIDAASGRRAAQVLGPFPGAEADAGGDGGGDVVGRVGDTVGVRVDLGPVTGGPPWRPSAAATAALREVGAVPGRAATAVVGNPHLVVVVADPGEVDVSTAGPALEADFPAGINVEFVAARPDGGLDLAVWERGAGDTGACGTGATAAAALAHRWGLVAPSVVVHMRGGDVTALVGGSTAELIGPATYVARIEVELV